jgi:hypothetical protein
MKNDYHVYSPRMVPTHPCGSWTKCTDIDEITATIETLRGKHELLSKLNSEILESTTEEEIDNEIEERDKYEFINQKTISKLTRLSKSSVLNPLSR